MADLVEECCSRFGFDEDVEEIELDRHRLGFQEARLIAAVVESRDFRNLHVLNVKQNILGEEGVRVLARSLKDNHHLQLLTLSRNGFGDDGLKALGLSIRYHPNLTSLDVSGNPDVTIQGWEHFAEVVGSNKTLKWVMIYKYPLPVKRLRNGTPPDPSSDPQVQGTRRSTLFRAALNIPPEYFGSHQSALEEESQVGVADPSGQSAEGGGSDHKSTLTGMLATMTISEETGGDDSEGDFEDCSTSTGSDVEDEQEASSLGQASGADISLTPVVDFRSSSASSSRDSHTPTRSRSKRKFSIAPTLTGDGVGREAARAAEKMSQIDWGGETMDLSCLLLNYADGLVIGQLIRENHHLEQINLTGTSLPVGPLDVESLVTRAACPKFLSLADAGLMCPDACTLSRLLEVNGTLEHLDLSRNEIGAYGAYALGGALVSNRGLRVLDLSRNPLCQTVDRGEFLDGAVRFGEAIGENRGLLQLSLQATGLQDLPARALALGIARNSRLLNLDIRDNPDISDHDLQDSSAAGGGGPRSGEGSGRHRGAAAGGSPSFFAGGRAFAEALEANDILATLNGITLWQEGEKPRPKGLRARRVQGLPELHVNLSQQQDDGFQLFESAFIATRLRRSGTVTSINLSWNFLGCSHLELLASALPGHPTLTALDLSHNRLCDCWVDEWGVQHGAVRTTGIAALAKALGDTYKSRASSIRALDLRASHVRDPERRLADALQRNRALEVLNGMDLSDQATELDVADRPPSTPRLLGLDAYEASFIGSRLAAGCADELDLLLIPNKHLGAPPPLGDYAALSLARGLATNTNLATLDLAKNNLGPAGCAAILDAVLHSPRLEFLNLSGNDLLHPGERPVRLRWEALQMGKAHDYAKGKSRGKKQVQAFASGVTVRSSRPPPASLSATRSPNHTKGQKALENEVKFGAGGGGDKGDEESFFSVPSLLPKSLASGTAVTPGEVSIGEGEVRNEVALRALLRLLSENPRVTSLDLSNNRLDSAAMSEVAVVLGGGKSAIEKLNLARNPLGALGARAVATMLCGNGRLASLDLSSCKLTDHAADPSGVFLLSSSLEDNTTLRFLGLRGNRLQEEAAATSLMSIIAISDSLHHNGNLLHLEV